MRDRAHYLSLLERNPNAAIGFSLAAKMVRAARGYDPNEYDKPLSLYLKRKYGEVLTPQQVRKEMGCE